MDNHEEDYWIGELDYVVCFVVSTLKYYGMFWKTCNSSSSGCLFIYPPEFVAKNFTILFIQMRICAHS